jgi:hypothetical protein
VPSEHEREHLSLKIKHSIRSAMRSISKQDAIRRMRLKLIKISMFQNKAFASKRPKIRDRRLATKAKLKRSQMHNQAQKDSI